MNTIGDSAGQGGGDGVGGLAGFAAVVVEAKAALD